MHQKLRWGIFMRNIVIVESISTGKNFVHDIVSRGHNPVLLISKNAADTPEAREYAEHVKKDLETIEYDYDLIHEKDSYEETLEMVKSFNPLLVLPGNEKGVILATKLANDLGLLCNPIENLDAMTLKDEMQNRLAENNLRHIRGRVVKSVEEAVEFYEEEKLNEVVVKPIYSAGSTAVRICLNKDEMIESVRDVFNQKGYYGNDLNEVLVQERIHGEEYIVNTVSCNGSHRVTLVWKYNKVRTAEGGIIYDTCQTIGELNLAEAEMIEYAYNVADALGIQYGPVHGEYMIDENGPVLIEVNCRPCGGGMDIEFLDKISGQHETDSILDSYLKPNRFFNEQKKPYRLFAHGVVKFFITPKQIFAESSPMNNISIKLKSYYKSSLPKTFDLTKPFVKTEDLNTSCGFVYMVHEDLFVLYKDIVFLRKVESKAFDLVLSENRKDAIGIDEEECVESAEMLLEMSQDHATVLLVTDQKLERECVQVSLDEISKIKGTYDCVIINLNKSIAQKREDKLVEIFMLVFTTIKVGGFVFIPETTYRHFKSGRRGMEAIIRTLNLRIELPPHGVKGVVIASKT